MERNPYEYDNTVSWMPQQQQVYAGSGTNQYEQRLPPLRQVPTPRATGAAQKPKLPKPMPKARTLQLAHSLKQVILVASFVGFGTLSGLVALHQVGSTTTTSSTNQTTTTTSQKTSSSNGFLHQEGHNVGSDDSNNSTSSSSSNSSTSSASSSSQPVSGTRTS